MAERISKACVRCRAMKAKCIGGSDPPCRRCKRKGLSCEFVPRANAAELDSIIKFPSIAEHWKEQVETRLQKLEEENRHLRSVVDRLTVQLDSRISSVAPDRQAASLEGVMRSIEELKDDLPRGLASSDAWNIDVVTKLWTSFQRHMPELHFLSGGLASEEGRSSPLLTVAILFVAATRHPDSDLAKHSNTYFESFGRAVGSLSLHRTATSATGRGAGSNEASSRFDDVLGIVLVGLLAIGWVETVGLWVNTAYRLFLDGVNEDKGLRTDHWRELWEGLRTIELEHSSLRLAAPALPISPPDTGLGRLSASPPAGTAGVNIGALLSIMQGRMKPFIGRGLVTPWDRVCSAGPSNPVRMEANDLPELKGWAAEIDSWYAEHSKKTLDASIYIKAVILLNYHLHKIYVLSLALSLRPAQTIETVPQELLTTSRQALVVEMSGFDVWSSWDLVMLTNACLFLLNGLSEGRGEVKDVDLVRHFLGVLKHTQHPAPSLKHTLAARLHTALQSIDLTGRTLDNMPSQPMASGQLSTSPSAPMPNGANQIMQFSSPDLALNGLPTGGQSHAFSGFDTGATDPINDNTFLDLDALFAPMEQSMPWTLSSDIGLQQETTGTGTGTDWPSRYLGFFGQAGQGGNWLSG